MSGPITNAVTIVKKHKVGVSVGVLVVIVLLYVIKKGSSLASGGVASGGESALDLQYQQLQAATGVQQSGIAAQVETAQIAADTATANTAAALKATQDTLDAQTIINANNVAGAIAVTQIKADVAKDQIDTIGALESQQMSTAASLEKTVLDQSLKTGRSSTGITQIISGLFGQGPQAIAANQPSSVANSASSIIGSIGSVIGGVVEGIFA